MYEKYSVEMSAETGFDKYDWFVQMNGTFATRGTAKIAVVTAENVIVASPEPEALVNVPDAPGAPVPEQRSVVPACKVAKTVNVAPLLVNVDPTVAFADVTVNT